MEDSESRLIEIVERVADHEEIPASQLQPPLYEAIDTDALESLLRGSDGPPVEIRFEYAGYRIRAKSDGTFEVAEPSATAT
ncbi:HalOD1 output domain-containing protein [Haloarchaeobius sp. HRN-SO-5]|uniref:HalOD1 output domain-containing protein n=1 Tax=Haloarchaeobius sp. HRN-SO-5 TaxID=3446118 RepID=UPI003EBE1B6D